MKKLLALGIVAVLATVTLAQAPTASDLYQQALMAQEAEGNLAKAIELYSALLTQFAKDKTVAPMALLQLATCYQLLGRRDDARAQYARVVNDYPDATTMAATARAKLDALTNPQDGPFKGQLVNYLNDVGQPALSPDGNWMIYTKPVEGAKPPAAQLVLRAFPAGDEHPVVDLKGQFTWLRWSLDSRRIAFIYKPVAPAGVRSASASVPPGAASVHVYTVATKQVQMLGETVGATEIQWSPENTQIAVRVLLPGGASPAMSNLPPRGLRPEPSEARLVTLATGNVTSLGTTDGPAEFAWSPDNREMAFHVTDLKSKTDEIRIVEPASGQKRTLAVPQEPGPDHRSEISSDWNPRPWTLKDEIIFSTRPGDVWSVYLIPAHGGGPARKVCSEPDVRGGGGVCLGISFDGAHEVVAPTEWPHRLLWRDLTTGLDRPLTIGPGEELATVSNGLPLVFFSSNRDGSWALYAVPLDRGPVANPVRIAALPMKPDGLAFNPWTPSGRLVVGFEFPFTQVFKIAMDVTGHAAGTAIRVIEEFDETWNPSPSPDGRQVAYWYRSGARTGIALLDTATGSSQALMDQAEPPAPTTSWGPQGRTAREIKFDVGDPIGWQSPRVLVFPEPRRSFDDPIQLQALDTTTGFARPLAHGVINSTIWQLLPQSNELAYLGSSVKGDGAIHVRSLSDGSEHTLDTGPNAVMGFTLSSNHRQIAYVRLGRPFQELLDLDRPYPDEARVTKAFEAGAEIRLIGVDGQGDRLLVAFPNASLQSILVDPIAWSPDDKFLLFTGPFGGLRVASTETGGQGWGLGGFPGTKTSEQLQARWAADGSILLTKKTRRAEWKTWEGITYDAVIRLINAKAKVG